MSRSRVVSANTPSTQPRSTSATPGASAFSPQTTTSLAGASRSSSPIVATGSIPDSQNGSRSGSPMSFSSGASTFGVPNGADIKFVYEAYCRSQIKVAELENEVMVLKRQLADAKIDKRPSGDAESDVNAEGSVPTAEEISKRGRNHLVFSHMFQLDPSIFTSPRPSFNSTSLARYTSPENQVAGLTAELYERMPPALHEHMAAVPPAGKPCSMFVKLFRDAQSSSRSTILLNLRNEASLIFDLPAAYFSKSSSGPSRDTIPELQFLLGIDTSATGAAAYPRFPPVLYLNGNTLLIEGRFLNEYLFMIARTILFGKTAAKNKARAIARSSSSYLYVDQAVATTFGLIAAVAIFARYILSKDERFENDGIGPQTQINYAAEYEYYKRWLIEMSQNPASAAWIKHLVSRWDEEVFFVHNKAKKTLPTTTESEVIQIDDAEAIRRDLDQLHLASSAPPPSAETTPDTEPGSPQNTDSNEAAQSGPDPVISESQPDPEPPAPRTTRSRAQLSNPAAEASQPRGRGRAKRAAQGKKGN
ncbi:hypothetical protein CVT26_005456 [Gymnopilus dilepis]|uniref:Uncharacterized protein n=1 Tax=Gymnopilus dilepis TaxID=231916 RepID=A0A409W8G4_9AGAR|nr:hypothetical protein CVT26_005456 [Gymnopilus dilepis]